MQVVVRLNHNTPWQVQDLSLKADPVEKLSTLLLDGIRPRAGGGVGLAGQQHPSACVWAWSELSCNTHGCARESDGMWEIGLTSSTCLCIQKPGLGAGLVEVTQIMPWHSLVCMGTGSVVGWARSQYPLVYARDRPGVELTNSCSHQQVCWLV